LAQECQRERVVAEHRRALRINVAIGISCHANIQAIEMPA
jgi:hypothetical protein